MPKEEIAQADYDLSMNRYKEIVLDVEETRDPMDIIAEIEELDRDITQGLANLKAMLSEGNNMASTAKHGWPMVRLGDVCEILNGFAFSSKKFGAEGDMPIIRIRDVVSGTTSTYYSGDWDEKYLIQAGEILVGMDGDFNYARWNSAPALLNQRVCKVSADEQHITDAYLFHVLQFPLRDIWEKTAFVTVKHLSAKRLAEALIPLPPSKSSAVSRRFWMRRGGRGTSTRVQERSWAR